MAQKYGGKSRYAICTGSDAFLSNDYAVLNKAIETNDRELIIQAMKNISSIVVKSPLEEFESFVQLFNDESKPLLDF